MAKPQRVGDNVADGGVAGTIQKAMSGAERFAKMRAVHVVAVVALLGGGLWQLYARTQQLDLAQQNRVLAQLRTLKTVDSAWDHELLRQKSLASAPPGPRRDLMAPFRIAQLALSVEAQTLLNVSLNVALYELKLAFEDKASLVESYRDASVRMRAHVAALDDSWSAVLTALRELAARQPARGSELQGREWAVTLIHANARQLAVQGAGDEAREPLVADPARLAAGLPPETWERMARFIEQASSISQATATRDRLEKRLAASSAGPRVDGLTQIFDRTFDQALQNQQVYRQYLFAYAGALVVLLAYAGMRMLASYRAVGEINEALKLANEGLEQRVAERTQELSQALRQLRESEAMLVQTEKMSSLGQMVAGIVHEINTPLAYVKSSLESLEGHSGDMIGALTETEKLLAMLQQEHVEEDKLNAQFARTEQVTRAMRQGETLQELKKFVADGLHGINQISEIVVSLKNFSRLDRSKVARYDLNEGLDSALTIARNLVKHKVVKKTYGDLPAVTCSPSQINQVFLNLITNAAQATSDDGGTIYLRTSVKDDRHVIVEVADNGHGIPDDVLPKIFDPFYTTKEVGKGTGLGLSISYKIVESHGGTIQVASKVGVGTKFTVTLPVEGAAQRSA